MSVCFLRHRVIRGRWSRFTDCRVARSRLADGEGWNAGLLWLVCRSESWRAACSEWSAVRAVLLHGVFCSGFKNNQDKWRAAAFLGRGVEVGLKRRRGKRKGCVCAHVCVCMRERECSTFTWEKNVDKMDGKRTCLRPKNKRKKGSVLGFGAQQLT